MIGGIDEICAAIKDGFEDTRTVLEPAGALALAGLKRAVRSGEVAPGARSSPSRRAPT